MKNALTFVFQASLWPGLMAAWLGALLYMIGLGYDHVTAYMWTYYVGVVVIFGLELLLPYSLKWRRLDNQWANDLIHSALSRIVGSFTLRWLGVWFTVHVYPNYHFTSVWNGTNFWLQLIAAMLVCDFGRYWYHRLSYERWGGWAFHSIHHSARRLWVGNTSRTHFLDGGGFVISGFALLFICQFPSNIIFWAVVLNSFIGVLSHCNIKMRPGIFNYLFNTPILHRWHHSKVITEGNRNYGQLSPFWDHVFGTYHNPNRPSPEDIGTRGTPLPDNLLKQFYWPVTKLTEKGKRFWHYIGEKPQNKPEPPKKQST